MKERTLGRVHRGDKGTDESWERFPLMANWLRAIKDNSPKIIAKSFHNEFYNPLFSLSSITPINTVLLLLSFL